jgi:hypothetical protein
MKLAWLCYHYPFEDGDEERDVEIKFSEPAGYMYAKVVTIVYSEIQDEDYLCNR